MRERVLRSQHGAAGIFRLEQELTRLELVDLLVEQLVVRAATLEQQIPLDFGADDRGDLQQRAGTRRQPVHARRQHTLHRLREADLVQLRLQPMAAQPALHHALVDQQPRHFFDEQRHAARAFDQKPAQEVDLGIGTDQVPDQQLRVRVVERSTFSNV